MISSNRPYQYEVYLMLEDAELVQTYKRLKDAYLAVHKFMEKNGYVNV